MPKATTGGLPDIALKKENGAAFSVPSTSCVVTQAIGRGPIVATSNLYTFSFVVPTTSNSMAVPCTD